MENITLTRKQLENITSELYWISGGEGTIYRIPINKHQRILLKLFWNPFSKATIPEQTLKNKQQKIKLLQEIAIPNEVQILSSAFFEDQFLGYFMNEAKEFQEFSYNTCSCFEQLQFLKRLKKQLIRFHELGIIYGDLKSDNVLIHLQNWKKGCLCDLDNIQLQEFPIDTINQFADEFLFQYGIADEKLDWYALNLLTLETFYRLDRKTYITYQETREFMDHYKGQSKALREMQHITPDYEGSLLIDDPDFHSEIGLSYLLK